MTDAGAVDPIDFSDSLPFLLVTSDKGKMRLPAFACLSVSKITQKRVHGFG